MRTLSQIYPIDYPYIPTVEDLKYEVREMLCHCFSKDSIVHYLSLLECPYHQEALTVQTIQSWHEMEQARKEPAVYLDMEGCWHFSWIDIDMSLRGIIKRAHALQIELERMAESTHDCSSPELSEPSKSIESSAPTEPVMTHVEHVDVMYNNCTIYQYAAPMPAPLSDEQKFANDMAASPVYPSFFRTNAQSISKIEQCFDEAMSFATKTKCVRFLLEHSRKDGCFDFSNMTNQERADALNKCQDRHCFKAGDFENAVHRLKR